jgi:hypothetical protein
MQIVFRDCPPLNIELDKTPLAQQWLKLIQKTYQQDSNAIFRDPPKYTATYLNTLAQQAHDRLGWNWDITDLGLASTTLMHKDIESYLAQGYANIPEEFDELLHEIHFCLHAVESGSKRNSWLQIEWFNDHGFPILANDYPAKINLEFGDLRLQNPYVGHHPLFLYQQNDHYDIMQTCRFHDLAKPGACIVVKSESNSEFEWDAYLNWFIQYGSEFVARHGLKNLIAYTGHPVIGRVTNLLDLEQCLQKEYLDFETIIF